MPHLLYEFLIPVRGEMTCKVPFRGGGVSRGYITSLLSIYRSSYIVLSARRDISYGIALYILSGDLPLKSGIFFRKEGMLLGFNCWVCAIFMAYGINPSFISSLVVSSLALAFIYSALISFPVAVELKMVIATSSFSFIFLECRESLGEYQYRFGLLSYAKNTGVIQGVFSLVIVAIVMYIFSCSISLTSFLMCKLSFPLSFL